MQKNNPELARLTSVIVSAYVENNMVSAAQLPEILQGVHAALSGLDAPPVEPAAPAPSLTAGQIRKSITPEALISFEDGRPYKTLKRHLSSRGMTIAEYKAKWGLPADYPVTAPAYSEARSAMAKTLGLGRKAGSGKRGRKA